MGVLSLARECCPEQGSAVLSKGGTMKGVFHERGWGASQQAGGMHPTGTHSCFMKSLTHCMGNVEF